MVEIKEEYMKYIVILQVLRVYKDSVLKIYISFTQNCYGFKHQIIYILLLKFLRHKRKEIAQNDHDETLSLIKNNQQFCG